MDNKNFLRKSKDGKSNRGRGKNDRSRSRDRNRKDQDRSGSKNRNSKNKNRSGSKNGDKYRSKNSDNFGSKYSNRPRRSMSDPRDIRDRRVRDATRDRGARGKDAPLDRVTGGKDVPRYAPRGRGAGGKDVPRYAPRNIQRDTPQNFTTKKGSALVKNIISSRPPLTGQTVIHHGNADKDKKNSPGKDKEFIRVVNRSTPSDRTLSDRAPSDHQKLLDELSESLSQQFEAPDYEPQIKDDEETEGFLFVYEANGVYFRSLNDIEKADGRLVVIHPVFYAGYNNTMFSEEVTYDASKDKYVAKEEDRSWLDVIYNYPEVVYSMDLSEAIVYDEKIFHCDGDLAYYLLGSEPETVTINGKTEETDKQLEH